MALTLPASIKVTAEVAGSQNLNTLARQLQQLSASSQISGRSLDRLYTETRKLGGAAGNTISSLQGQARAMRALRDEVEVGSRKFNMLSRDIEAVEGRLRRYQQTASQGGGLSKGNTLLAGFAGGIAGAATAMVAQQASNAVGGIVQSGLDAETAQVRLKALTTQFGEYNQAQASTERIAKTLRISTTEATDGFSKLYAALRPTGVTLKETEDAFVGFTAAARVSGATSTEASAALLQLKQALGSGVLQGDELRSLREQAPLAAQAIAREMGVTIGEIKKLGSEGKITTDIVLRALATLKEENLGKLNQQFDTGAQAIKDFQVAAENLGKTLARVFGPTTLRLLREVTRGIQDITDVIGTMTGNNDAQERLKDKVSARDMAADEAGKRFGISGLWRQGEKESFFQQRQQQILDKLEEQRMIRREQQAAKEAGTRDQQRAKDDAAEERQAARNRAAEEAQKASEKAAKDLREADLRIRQEAEDRLADAVRNRDQQIRDFRLETIKRAADLERQLGDQRAQIEREIEASKLVTARSIEDRGLEQELRNRRGQGLSTNKIEEARAVNDIFRQFEDQVQQTKQTALDRQLALQRQLEEFKISITDGIGKIQEAYARSVSSILQDAGQKLARMMEQGAENAAAVLGGALGPGSATPGSVPAGSVGVQSLVGLARQVGFSGNNAAIMAAIAMAESGGRSTAHNPNRDTGDNSYGLWQINMIDGMGPQRRRAFGIANNEALFDPATNANAARQVYQSQGFGAWSVYRSGAYKAYLPQAMAAARNGSARQLIGSPGASQPAASAPPPAAKPDPGVKRDLDAARAKADQAGAQMREAVKQAAVESQKSAFASSLGSLDARLTSATAELEGQVRSARAKLEDERTYQLLLSQGVTPELARQRVELERMATSERENLETQIEGIDKQIQSGKYTETEIAQLEEQKVLIQQRINQQGQLIAQTELEIEATERLKKAREEAEGRDIGKGFRDGVSSYLESIGTLADGVKGVTSNALKGLEDQMVNFVTTGKANFQELARSILADMARIAIQQMVLRPILQGVGSMFGVSLFSADGNAFTESGVVPFAQGGVVNSPTLFKFANGGAMSTGVMGEAGPEAIMPLKRGRDGKLGVAGAGSGGDNVTVNVAVDAKGSTVEGNGQRGQQLGQVIAQAVQAELVKQKRPGGLLAA